MTSIQTVRNQLAVGETRCAGRRTVAFDAEQEEHLRHGGVVRVYSVAKTVADCFKFHSRLRLDMALEALKVVIEERRATVNDHNVYGAGMVLLCSGTPTHKMPVPPITKRLWRTKVMAYKNATKWLECARELHWSALFTILSKLLWLTIPW